MPCASAFIRILLVRRYKSMHSLSMLFLETVLAHITCQERGKERTPRAHERTSRIMSTNEVNKCRTLLSLVHTMLVI